MSDNIYNTKVYENAGNLELLELLPASADGRVLDCGCGAGDNARILSSRGWKVSGITISPAEREIAAQYCEQVHVANLENGFPQEIQGHYDVIVMSHILEHLVTPHVLLNDAHRLLKSNGLIAVALPNVLHYRQRFEFLLGKFDYAVEGLMDETHVHFYTFTSGVDLLNRHGYRVLTKLATGSFPLWKIRKHVPGKWVKQLNRLACNWKPGFFGYQCIYLAQAN